MYLLECKMNFFPKFHVWSAEPDCAKLDCSDPDDVDPNQGTHHKIIMGDMRSSDITQCTVVIPCRHFGTTYQSHLQGSRNPKEITQHNWSWLTQSSFLGHYPLSNFLLKKQVFQNPAIFPSSGKEAPNLVDLSDSVVLSVSHHKNSNALRFAPENISIQG
jgi:hypothetical protein